MSTRTVYGRDMTAGLWAQGLWLRLCGRRISSEMFQFERGIMPRGLFLCGQALFEGAGNILPPRRWSFFRTSDNDMKHCVLCSTACDEIVRLCLDRVMEYGAGKKANSTLARWMREKGRRAASRRALRILDAAGVR